MANRKGNPMSPGSHFRKTMSHRSPLRALVVAVLACLGVLASSAPAFATHEQGGYITASVTADGHLKGK